MYVVTADNEQFKIIEETNYEEEKELNMVKVVEEDQAIIELSINSVVGYLTQVLWKWGKTKDREVVILIDCGATHNFISEKVANELQLTTKDTSHYEVILGSGAAVKGKGICEAVELMLNEWKIVANFLPLELGRVDVVLGMQWLYSLSNTEVDWKNLTMTFLHQEKKIIIKGDPSLTKARVSLKNMIKTWEESDQGFLVEFRSMERGSTSSENSEREIEEVLTIEE